MNGVRVALPRGPRLTLKGTGRRLTAPESSRIDVAYLHVISSFLDAARRLELSDAERCHLSERLCSQLDALAGIPGVRSTPCTSGH